MALVLALDTAFISREGDDVTLVSWGAMLKKHCKQPQS